MNYTEQILSLLNEILFSFNTNDINEYKSLINILNEILNNPLEESVEIKEKVFELIKEVAEKQYINPMKDDIKPLHDDCLGNIYTYSKSFQNSLSYRLFNPINKNKSFENIQLIKRPL